MNPSFHAHVDGTAPAAQPRRTEPGSGSRQAAVPITGAVHHRDTLEARLAASLAQTLGEATSMLPLEVCERLRFAREAALARAAQQRRAGAAAQPRPSRWWPRWRILQQWGPAWQGAAAAAPLLVLVLGLVLIDRQLEQEELHALANIDTLLLSDGLPPAAYADPGFAEFLRHEPPP